MTLKFGYDYHEEYELKFGGDSGVIYVIVNDYDVEITVDDGKIVMVRPRTYDFDVVIPTDDIKYHNAIQKVIREVDGR